jgi:uncharacterized protein RhaS with RHS repeats
LGAFTYELRFPGQFFDQATRLHYNYFRDYDPRRHHLTDKYDGGGNPLWETAWLGRFAAAVRSPDPARG